MEYENVARNRRRRGAARPIAMRPAPVIAGNADDTSISSIVQPQPLQPSALDATAVETQVLSAEQSAEKKLAIHNRQAQIPAAVLSSASPTIDPRRFTGSYVHSDFDGVVIGFRGTNQTTIDWGSLLERVNSTVYQYYFGLHQSPKTVPELGVDPPTLGDQTWSRATLEIQSLSYSGRFGGSLHLRLIPSDSYGIEIQDQSSNLYIDLHDWTLDIHLRLRKQIFNSPLLAMQIKNSVVVSLNIARSEALRRDGQRFYPADLPSTEALDDLIHAAEQEALERLDPIYRLMMGFVHEKHLFDFSYVGESVTDIFVEDKFFSISTQKKIPYVQLQGEFDYMGTGCLEGFFDGDAEMMAQPWIIVRKQGGLVILSSKREKYIGSKTSTGILNFGYMSLEEAAQAHELTLFTGWVEYDPIEDDHGTSYAQELDIDFSLDELKSRSDANDLGLIGREYYLVAQDWHQEDLYIFSRLWFSLIKR